MCFIKPKDHSARNRDETFEIKTLFEKLEKHKKEGIIDLSHLDRESKEIFRTFENYEFNKSGLTDEDKENSPFYLRDIFYKNICDKFMKKTFFESPERSYKFVFENDLIGVAIEASEKKGKNKEQREEEYKLILTAAT